VLYGARHERRAGALHRRARRPVHGDSLVRPWCVGFKLQHEILGAVRAETDLELIHHAGIKVCLRSKARRDQRPDVHRKDDILGIRGGKNKDISNVRAGPGDGQRRVLMVRRHSARLHVQHAGSNEQCNASRR